jgi:hypothetical protein
MPWHCKPYAIAIRLKRVWCVLAMVTHACFDIEVIVRERQRLSYGVLAMGI